MRFWVSSGFLYLCARLCISTAYASDDARDDPWSVSLYAGPATTKFIGAIAQSGFNYHPTAAAAGLDVDRRLIYLGGDLWIAADAQGAQYWFGHHDRTYGAGLGFLVDDPFGWAHTRFSIYDGPSWDSDPPYLAIGYKEKVHPEWRRHFLNYLTIDYAVRLPHSENWDGVLQFYHRSGMFGVISPGDDESTVIGFGVRYRF